MCPSSYHLIDKAVRSHTLIGISRVTEVPGQEKAGGGLTRHQKQMNWHWRIQNKGDMSDMRDHSRFIVSDHSICSTKLFTALIFAPSTAQPLELNC